jgi:hypothetical protein
VKLMNGTLPHGLGLQNFAAALQAQSQQMPVNCATTFVNGYTRC